MYRILLVLFFVLLCMSLNSEEALFSVTTATGDTIFAVYPSGIIIKKEIIVTDSSGNNQIMIANSDSVRIYLSEPESRASRGGFAVGGVASRTNDEYFLVTPDSVRVYIKDIPATRASRGGFAVGGVASRSFADFLYVAPDSTRIFVADSTAGFSIANIETGEAENFLNLNKNNYFIGHESGKSNTTGSYNAFFGYQSGFSNNEGFDNLFLGYQSGFANSGGVYNTFMGFRAGYTNIGEYNPPTSWEGCFNTFTGCKAGYSNTTGYYNSFYGNISGYSNSTGSRNTFYGNNSGLQNETRNKNTFLGNASGYSHTSEDDNTFIGAYSGRYDTSGSENTYIGTGAGYGYDFNESAGTENTFIGYNSGSFIRYGEGNTAIGYKSGFNLNDGEKNVFLGYRSGYDETGSNKLYIANGATSDSTLIYGEFGSNLLGFGTLNPEANLHIVGNDTLGSLLICPAEPTSNGDAVIFLSEDDDNSLGMSVKYDGDANQMYIFGKVNANIYGPHLSINRSDGNVGIGTTDPSSFKLYVDGTAYSTGGWSEPSDERLKKNINTIDNALNKVQKLRGIEFEWKDNKTHQKGKHIGFIAQEAKDVIPEVVDQNEGFYSMQYAPITALLVEAIKELKSENEELRNKILQIELLQKEGK